MDCSAQFINFHNEEVPAMMRRCAVTIKGHSSTRRQAVHIIFVIDTSDSMNDGITSPQGKQHSKLQQVKDSIEFLIPLLTQDDAVSILSFGDVSTIHLKGVIVNEEGRNDIQTVLRGLHTDGCTNMSAGLLNIQDVLDEVDLPEKKPGVLLLTDGHANMGVANEAGLQSIIHQLVNRNPSLTLTSIGYGHDHNAELMRTMAIAGSGSYNVVYNLEGIATTFGEVLGGLTTVVAQNVVIQLPYGSAAHTGYNLQSTGANLLVKVGDIYAENEIVVVCDITDGSIQVKGVNMSSMDRVQTVLIPIPAPEETPKTVQLAYYRQKVSHILETQARDKARELLEELRGLSYVADVLVQMMIDDLEHILVDRRVNSTNMLQHAAFLSLGRGLRSHMPDEDPVPHYRAQFNSPVHRPIHPANFIGVQEDEQELTPPAVQRRNFQDVLSPFSNRVQSSNTQMMRTSSQRNES